MKKHFTTTHIAKYIFLLLLLIDFGFSFVQYYQTPMYGDISNGVLPGKDVQQILADPIGFRAIKTGEKHVNPNRFFSHIALMKYFQNVPSWLQSYVSPIDSIYLASALLKISIQLLIIICLSFLITGSKIKPKYLMAALIVSPLFQVYGFWSRMGINDKSIAYTFFYALPITMLLIFYLLIINSINNKRISLPIFILLVPFTIILPLSGPLIPGIVLVISLLILVYLIIEFRSQKQFSFKILFSKIPPFTSILIFLISIWSFYSLALGFYDSNYKAESISILARYNKIPDGIFSQIFHSAGFPIMLLVIGINIYLIKKYFNTSEGKRILYYLLWIGLFAVIYILLLPLGGYRPYRPRIIRYDTFMPITIALMYLFGKSSYFLIHQFKSNKKIIYTFSIVICLLFFTVSDIDGLNENKCERQSLDLISSSTDSIVIIPNNCHILSWESTKVSKHSEKRADLFLFWNITDVKKLFYNKPIEK